MLIAIVGIGSLWQALSRESEIEELVASDDFDVVGLSERWAAQPFTDLAQMDRTSLGALIEGHTVDSLGVLSGAQRAALGERIALELVLRASTNPDDYVEHARADESTRWLPSDDEFRWHIIDTWYRAQFGEAAPRSDPEEALRRTAERVMTSHGGRFMGLGALDDADAQSMDVHVFQVRSEEQISVLLDQSYASTEERNRWTRGPSNGAIRFREPVRSFDQVVRENGAAKVASVRMIIRLADGKPVNWMSYWYWDPKPGAWQNLMMGRKGVYIHALFY